MRFKLNADETLSTGFAAAGTSIPVTGANAEELYSLSIANKGTMIDENDVAATPGDVGPGVASYNAGEAGASPLTLSSASPRAGQAAGSIVARVRGNPTTLIDDGGGRVTLSGRTLLATATPFIAGVPVRIAIGTGSTQRTFSLYPTAAPVYAPPPRPSGDALFSARDGGMLYSAIDGSILQGVY